ncbi:MAG TPA: hypothetical protein VMW75_01545 [Thermoanaerobaculia bacterium]|nr:hypothetical protein [Thermoanaerobaculia bacterium]
MENVVLDWRRSVRDVGRKTLIAAGEWCMHCLLVALILAGMRGLQFLVEALWRGEELLFFDRIPLNEVFHTATFILLAAIFLIGILDIIRALTSKAQDWSALADDASKTFVAAAEWCSHCLLVALLFVGIRGIQLVIEYFWRGNLRPIKALVQTADFLLLASIFVIGVWGVARAYRG